MTSIITSPLHEAHVLRLINVSYLLQEDTPKKNCLLQMMEIESATSLSMNVLWDSGSTLSLITFKKAAQLNIVDYNWSWGESSKCSILCLHIRASRCEWEYSGVLCVWCETDIFRDKTY